MARWDQWVFVNPDPAAPSLDSVIQDIQPFTDELNADLRGYEFQVRYEYTMECNWKIWAENAVECYHCPTLHRSSFGRTYDTRPDHYLLGSWEDTITNQGPIKWLPEGVDPASLKGFRFAYLWPTSFFALDDYVGFVGAIMPLAPERCLAFVDMYSKPGADPSIVADWLKMWDQTLIEDQAATDNQQVGYRSGRVPRRAADAGQRASAAGVHAPHLEGAGVMTGSPFPWMYRTGRYNDHSGTSTAWAGRTVRDGA